MKVYLVMTSNCEMYEDYNEYIDSVWSSMDKAVKYIESEKGLGMKRAPRDRFGGGIRWHVICPEYAVREDETDEEWAEYCADYGEDGKPPLLWEDEFDAWVVEMELDGSRDFRQTGR